MKIPQIHGRHKIRDTKICRDYIQENFPPSQLAEKFKLSVSTIYRILYKNRQFLTFDKEWEKVKRIQTLKKLAKKAEEKGSRKDVTDIVDQLRKEIEGDKPLVDQSIHTTYSQVKVVIDDNTNISSSLQSRVSPSRPK